MECDRDCIVTFVDLIDIGKLAELTTTEGSGKMRQFHALIEERANHGLSTHSHVYAWNDSAVFLAFPDLGHSDQDALQEIDQLKRQIDQVSTSYAISVKGKAFGDPNPLSSPVFEGTAGLHQPKFVFLRMSSYAFSNCFIIEKQLGAKLRKPWYVDERIVRNINTKQTHSRYEVTLLPGNKERAVYAYDGYLW